MEHGGHLLHILCLLAKIARLLLTTGLVFDQQKFLVADTAFQDFVRLREVSVEIRGRVNDGNKVAVNIVALPADHRNLAVCDHQKLRIPKLEDVNYRSIYTFDFAKFLEPHLPHVEGSVERNYPFLELNFPDFGFFRLGKPETIAEVVFKDSACVA